MASRVPPRPLNPMTTLRLKREPIRDQDYRSWINKLPCLVTGQETDIQAAHISYPDPRYGKRGRAYGKKEDDRWCVPLTKVEHNRQHRIGEYTFWSDAGINPCIVALSLWGIKDEPERDDLARIIIMEHRNAATPSLRRRPD